MRMQFEINEATEGYEPHEVLTVYIDEAWHVLDSFITSLMPHMKLALEEITRDYEHFINPEFRNELIEQHEFTAEQQAEVLSESRTMFDVADYLAKLNHDAAVDCTLRGY